MKNSHHAFTRSCVAVAIVLAFPADYALADDVQALIRRGWALARLGYADSAATDFDRAIALPAIHA